MTSGRVGNPGTGRVAGVDVGGTFTDLVIFDPDTGAVELAKVPTTLPNQAGGVLAAFASVNADLSGIDLIVHGTTTTTNAVLERRLAKTGLITNIHLWASWWEDRADTNAVFQLGFWTDVPRSTAPIGELLVNGTFELAFTNAGLSGPLDSIVDFIPPSWNRVESFSGGGAEN